MPEGAAGAETAAVQETGAVAAPAGAAAGGAPDIEALLMDRFGQFEQQIGSSLDQRFAALAPPEPEVDPYAEALGSVYEDPAEREAVGQALQGVFQPLLEQATAPLMQELSQLRAELDAGDLEARYPALQNPETAQQAMQAAAQLAQKAGLDPAQYGRNPALIEAAFLMQAAQARAQSETPAGGTPVGLESAGGAATSEPGPNVAQQILAAGGPQTAARQVWQW